MKRTTEGIFTFIGTVVGIILGVIFSDTVIRICSCRSISAVLIAVIIGLVYNKIGSELDRKNFIKGNNIVSVPKMKRISATEVIPVEEYRKLPSKEKLRVWINETDYEYLFQTEEGRICSAGRKK